MRILKLLFLISSLLAGLNSIAQVNLPTMEVKATPMAWSMPIRIYAWAFEDGDLGDPGGNIGGFPDQYYAIPAPENCVGNPVILETGRKTEQEVDFESQGEMGLGLTRTYLNVFDNPNVLNMFGNGWKSQYENTLSTVATNNGAFLFISRPSGEVKRFKRVIINGRPTTTGKLYEEEGPEAIEYVTWVSNGVSINGILYPVYKYFVSDGSVETYWINGQMLSRYKNGIGWELEYDCCHSITYGDTSLRRLMKVIHTSGKTIQFQYTSSNLLKVIDPDGNVYSGVSGFLCEEPYTAREGEEEVWPRTTRADSPQSFWTSCWLAVTPRRYWILAA